ncbi:MAG: hypothetical protein ACRDSH_18925 [Pseudonocardiaceae bacterium]
MRAPLVCGVAGGVGATTIAAALQAQDLGIYCGGPVDLVVCRTTSSSVAAAHRVVNAAPGKPVLVVVADGPLRIPAPAKARLTMVEPYLTALVAMPYVTRWRETDQALEQAVAALRYPNQVPKWLQPWAEALGQVMAAVLPLVDSAPGVPGAASGDVVERPANSARDASPEPRAATAGGQRPDLVVVQGSRPIPPSAATGNSNSRRSS